MDNITRAKKVRLLVLDVDGTLTDGSVFIGENGEIGKRFNAKDGLGITAARRAGLLFAIITGRKSGAILEKRAAELKIEHLFQGVEDKGHVLQELCARLSLGLEQVAYVGDDLNDLPVLALAGFAAAPADAVAEVKESVHYVASLPGGKGAVREIIECILRAQDKWAEAVDSYRKKGCGGQ